MLREKRRERWGSRGQARALSSSSQRALRFPLTAPTLLISSLIDLPRCLTTKATLALALASPPAVPSPLTRRTRACSRPHSSPILLLPTGLPSLLHAHRRPPVSLRSSSSCPNVPPRAGLPPSHGATHRLILVHPSARKVFRLSISASSSQRASRPCRASSEGDQSVDSPARSSSLMRSFHLSLHLLLSHQDDLSSYDAQDQGELASLFVPPFPPGRHAFTDPLPSHALLAGPE